LLIGPRAGRGNVLSMHKRPAVTMPRAGEFMSHPVFALRPEQDVMEALEGLIHRGYSGAPVTDESGRLVGVLSEQDCLRVMSGAAFHATPEGHVCDNMSRGVETITPDTDLFAVAAMFEQGRHRRLPVVEDGRLIGIVARRDVLRALDRLRRGREAATERFEARAERRSALHE